MVAEARMTNPGMAAKFAIVRATDPAELDQRSRISGRMPTTGQSYRYSLRERALWHARFAEPIFTLAIRDAGPILVSHAESRFATDVGIDGAESDLFCVTMPQRGSLTLMRDGVATVVDGSGGIVLRPGPRTRMLMSDDSVRANVFVRAGEVERALEHALDSRLRRPLEFLPRLDWHGGLAASLKGHLDMLLAEFGRPDGLADNAVALAPATDLLVALLLHGVPHSYSEELRAAAGGAVPAYVRRAEDYMREKGAEPIRIADVAAAAGCSQRTLNDVFRRFRGKTPLAAVHAIRLERVREALLRDRGLPVAAVARRHGFTNIARFAAAFRRHFGETPSEVARRGSRA